MELTSLKRWLLSIATLILCASSAAAQSHTQLIILGTGTPIINPDRSGPSVAVVVNGSAYLVDFGPGVVRRAAAAARDKHIVALTPKKFKKWSLPLTCILTTLLACPIFISRLP